MRIRIGKPAGKPMPSPRAVRNQPPRGAGCPHIQPCGGDILTVERDFGDVERSKMTVSLDPDVLTAAKGVVAAHRRQSESQVVEDELRAHLAGRQAQGGRGPPAGADGGVPAELTLTTTKPTPSPPARCEPYEQRGAPATRRGCPATQASHAQRPPPVNQPRRCGTADTATARRRPQGQTTHLMPVRPVPYHRRAVSERSTRHR